MRNVTEAWSGGGEVRTEKTDSRYSVAGAGDGKWPSPLRPPGHPIQLICAFEEEKPVSCDRLNNGKSVFPSAVNRLSQTYQILISGDGLCVISGMQELWTCQVCLAARLR